MDPIVTNEPTQDRKVYRRDTHEGSRTPPPAKDGEDVDAIPAIAGCSEDAQTPQSARDKDPISAQSSRTISQPIRTGPKRSSTGEPSSTVSSSNPTSGLSTAPEAINHPVNESIRPAGPNPPAPSEPEKEHNDKGALSVLITPADTLPPKEEQGSENYEFDDDELSAVMTRYMKMLLELDNIPRIHNLAASFFTWILLAGFVLFPGTFASLRIPDNINDSNVKDQVVKALLDAVKHLSHVALFVIAFVCCGIGAAGMCYLWWKWYRNYVWLVNKIFLPGLLNSLAGLISTIASVYGAQGGRFTLTSKVTLTVTGSTMVVCGLLTMYFLLWEIRKVKLEHHRLVGNQDMGERGERLLQRIKREANERVGPVGSLLSLV